MKSSFPVEFEWQPFAAGVKITGIVMADEVIALVARVAAMEHDIQKAVFIAASAEFHKRADELDEILRTKDGKARMQALADERAGGSLNGLVFNDHLNYWQVAVNGVSDEMVAALGPAEPSATFIRLLCDRVRHEGEDAIREEFRAKCDEKRAQPAPRVEAARKPRATKRK